MVIVTGPAVAVMALVKHGSLLSGAATVKVSTLDSFMTLSGHVSVAVHHLTATIKVGGVVTDWPHATLLASLVDTV
jgi:hypothetical protein